MMLSVLVHRERRDFHHLYDITCISAESLWGIRVCGEYDGRPELFLAGKLSVFIMCGGAGDRKVGAVVVKRRDEQYK